MGKNSSKKKVKNDKSRADKKDDTLDDVSISGGFSLIDDEKTKEILSDVNETTNPISIAMSILGCDRSVFTIAGDLRKKQPNAFYYNQYGVSLYFEEDEEAELFKVLNHKSKPSSTAPAYWLIDKLVAETNGRLFFSPGREGIQR